LKHVKIRDVLKLLRHDGWVLKNQEGTPFETRKSYDCGTPIGRVGFETKKSILKQAGLE
jgi:predicted RNA binding protein YcfA (HicA-like mRNA interferase family)